MAIPKSLKALSSIKLFELAKKKEQQELEVQKTMDLKKQGALEKKAQKLTTKYNKELAALERKIAQLGGASNVAATAKPMANKNAAPKAKKKVTTKRKVAATKSATTKSATTKSSAKKSTPKKKTAAKGKRSNDASSKIVALIKDAGKITTKELKAQLDRMGVPTKYLYQSLAYLKSKGTIASPARSEYELK